MEEIKNMEKLKETGLNNEGQSMSKTKGLRLDVNSAIAQKLDYLGLIDYQAPIFPNHKVSNLDFEVQPVLSVKALKSLLDKKELPKNNENKEKTEKEIPKNKSSRKKVKVDISKKNSSSKTKDNSSKLDHPPSNMPINKPVKRPLEKAPNILTDESYINELTERKRLKNNNFSSLNEFKSIEKKDITQSIDASALDLL